MVRMVWYQKDRRGMGMSPGQEKLEGRDIDAT